MNPRRHSFHPAITVLTVAVAGCATAPPPVTRPEVHVAEGFARNPEPAPVLQVQAYAGIRDATREGKAQAGEEALAAATYMAKMAADVRGLRFVRVGTQIRLGDAAPAYSIAVAIPQMRYGGVSVTGTATRSEAVLAQMARLDVAEITATLANPSAEAIANAFYRCYWEAIRKFAAEKYAINLSGPLQGNITIVDFKIDEDANTMKIALQLNVRFPKRKHATRPRAPSGKKRKRRTLHDLPPHMRAYLRSLDESRGRAVPRSTEKTRTHLRPQPETKEAQKQQPHGEP